MGTLFLVSTPIGNPEDITLRALRVFREVDLVAAEDARQTTRLLAGYAITTPCLAYHEHNKLARLDEVLAALDRGDVALVANAGTPAMAAPGFELVSACIAAGYAVVPVPGPSAPLAALVASGLPTDRFVYLGPLPRRGAERRALVQRLADAPETLVAFEEPHRLCDTLEDLLAILGNRRATVARDLTRPSEEFRRGRLGQMLAHYSAHRPRGEYTLIVEGLRWRDYARDDDPAVEALPSESEVAERLRILRAQGRSGSAASREVARTLGLSRSIVYQVWISLDREGAPGQ